MPVQRCLQPPTPDHLPLHSVLWQTMKRLQHILWNLEPRQRMTLSPQMVSKGYRQMSIMQIECSCLRIVNTCSNTTSVKS
ncbi:hypothetical protein VN97_g5964 [Penicillium thymicola]|uniref:Uncharacterized protein n=1 Tax=Penicillium thymicola TaxID=293382 RepID=A0AAI9X7X4_PENTH|nr:hypothetical protein VN97_g5964 [Penicillium thymicola]